MYKMSSSDQFHPFFTSIRPNLLVCKLLGACSISNIFSSSNTKTLEWKAWSFGNLYVIIFVLFCQYFISGGIIITKPKDFRGLITFLVIFQSVLNTISDKNLLYVLRNTEEADELIKPFLGQDKPLLSSFSYKWLILIFTLDLYIFYYTLCVTDVKECLTSRNIFVWIYYHGSFFSVASLFCTVISELEKRFRVLRTIIERRREMCENPEFLEGCRHIHTQLCVAGEGFCECFSARVTNQLAVVALHLVTKDGSSCFFSRGCDAFSFVQIMLQQLMLVCMICFCAHKLDEQVSCTSNYVGYLVLLLFSYISYIFGTLKNRPTLVTL